MAMIVAGVGCTSTCDAAAIVALVRLACARSGQTPTLLAAPAFKADQPGLRDAARLLGLKLTLIERSAMERAQPRAVTRSEAAAAAVGLASVAEAAALAAAGPDAVLLLPRLAGAGVTCALAGGA